MPLYDQVELLCQAILTQGRQEAERIVRQAREEADRLVAAEEARCREEVRRASEEVRAQALLTARNLVDRAALESKRRIAEAKEALLEEIFKLGIESLQAFQQSADYPNWLRRMLTMALHELFGGRLRIKANPEEARWLTDALLQEAAQEAGARLELEMDTEVPAGGFIAVREDGRMRLDQTFQGIINRQREHLRTEMARRLWGSQ
jgi:V/A-type H+/Na+-transporting ATPase subunit E